MENYKSCIICNNLSKCKRGQGLALKKEGEEFGKLAAELCEKYDDSEVRGE